MRSGFPLFWLHHPLDCQRQQRPHGPDHAGATRLDPPPRFPGGQEGVEESLAGLMGEHAAAKVLQQGTVKPWIRQVETLLALQLGDGRCASQGSGALTPSVLPTTQGMPLRVFLTFDV